MSMNTHLKLYCVHVYERPHVFEDIAAKNPAEARGTVIKREWNGDYNLISHVEVMRECDCGYDNDVRNSTCDECGRPL